MHKRSKALSLLLSDRASHDSPAFSLASTQCTTR
jgi:hypothetical protein